MQTLSFKEPPRKMIKFLIIFLIAILGGMILSNLLNFQNWLQPKIPLSAGEATVFNRSSNSFEQPLANLDEAGKKKHTESNTAFEANFVTKPAKINPGLGPFFNNASCAGCHLKNGRGLPEPGQLLVRVSAPKANPIQPGNYHLEGSVKIDNLHPVLGLGTQIQDFAVYGQKPEATVNIEWQEQTGQYGDGTSYNLRSPQPKITLPDGQLISPKIQQSLRVPPPVFGLGLLEAVPEKTLLNLADSKDKNQDGISGTVNQVWDAQKQSKALGRFGWKAGNPTLIQQNAGAYVNDMGVTNPLFTDGEKQTDIDQKTLDLTTFYVQTLAVPARTLLEDPKVKQGETLFTKANCISCHLPTLKTGNHSVQELANQTIHPYTDLLLHDLGPGLADHRPEFQASGTEWRTPALWGIGLTQTVSPYSGYLHDGRARTLEEAILWHGGEAETAKETFRNLNLEDRQALVRFLQSL
jgi:CxxC motif-containing protein (DUF1111 family)